MRAWCFSPLAIALLARCFAPRPISPVENFSVERVTVRELLLDVSRVQPACHHIRGRSRLDALVWEAPVAVLVPLHFPQARDLCDERSDEWEGLACCIEQRQEARYTSCLRLSLRSSHGLTWPCVPSSKRDQDCKPSSLLLLVSTRDLRGRS